ncbi:putative hemin transport protein [Chitinophaga sp. CF118]|uniref:hemin-degrading factor n=1 Tax=Chitinophaga sp. CF118 TaxID=1884367 RepID=UPI0008E566A8|nr:ChuX/HutX family heme-like substrate-binding protein [Chitinophaga sp. CF118]SFD18615.1 putative hemin transport protein [Chitinophaga sp. CF118]
MNATATQTLKDRWIAFREQNPKTRIRDAANQLKVSEGELVAACTGSAVKHIRNEFPAFVQRMPELGKVMVLTRNENCVIERKGVFEMINTENKHVGTVLGKDIDLRMFFSRWKFGFSVGDDAATGFKRSWQIFDAQGTAIVKIYPTDLTNLAAWDQLERDFVTAEQLNVITVSPAPEPKVFAQEADTAAFLQEWSVLQDTHDFFPLLMKYKLSRVHALEIAAGKFARRVENDCVKTILQDAAQSGLEIMVFVGNPGNIEIHTGPVQKILEIPSWINVMDPDFNLHLKTDGIAQCWVVEKPSADGVITSVEVFDATGEMIVQFFGKRKPGSPELEDWRTLTAKL